MSSCNWDNTSSTLNQIPGFKRQIYQNIQLAVTFNYIDFHPSIKLLTMLEMCPCLISSSFVGDIVLWFRGTNKVQSTLKVSYHPPSRCLCEENEQEFTCMHNHVQTCDQQGNSMSITDPRKQSMVKINESNDGNKLMERRSMVVIKPHGRITVWRHGRTRIIDHYREMEGMNDRATNCSKPLI
jgi:hypothetical protein